MKLDEVNYSRRPTGSDPVSWTMREDGSIDITTCLGEATRSLKDLELPQTLEGSFYCGGNYLTSLEGAPAYVGGTFVCSNNNLTNLHGIHKIIKYVGSGLFWCCENPISSHVLGVLLINGVTQFLLTRVLSTDRAKTNEQVQGIINKHLKSGKNILACQDELFDAGFPEYAKL